MYKSVPLFGGAARCDVPSNWIDASTLRDVPSNQEVFVNESGDTSVIIEILEYQENVADSEAGKSFFSDIAEADAAINSQIESVPRLGEKEFLGTRAVTCSVHGTQVKGKTGPSAIPSAVAVYMTVIRALSFDADILITTHAPVGISTIASVHQDMAESVIFLDPTLFG